MSSEGTSDVLLDMSGGIPHVGARIAMDPTAAPDFTGDVALLKSSEFRVKPREVEYIVPFGDRIVVLPDAAEEMIGSFYVPDVAKERPARGTVLAIGPLVDKESIGEGMKVIYGHFTGSECMHGGKECLIMREADLYGGVRTVTV